MTRRTIAPQDFPKALSDETDNYFKNGQGRVDTRYANLTATAAGVAHLEWIPGRIGIVNTSKKYIESNSAVAGFISSSQLPLSITEPIRGFSRLIDEDTTLMLDVLNARFSANPREFIEEEDTKKKKTLKVLCMGLYPEPL